MRKLDEQWIENGRMYKAVEGIHCSGCCYNEGDQGCYISGLGCPTDNGETDLVIRDLGPVNEDGLLPCPFCGEYPKIIHPTENMPVVSIVHTGEGHRILLEFFSSEQEAIDAWNRRA